MTPFFHTAKSLTSASLFPAAATDLLTKGGGDGSSVLAACKAHMTECLLVQFFISGFYRFCSSRAFCTALFSVRDATS